MHEIQIYQRSMTVKLNNSCKKWPKLNLFEPFDFLLLPYLVELHVVNVLRSSLPPRRRFHLPCTRKYPPTLIGRVVSLLCLVLFTYLHILLQNDRRQRLI